MGDDVYRNLPPDLLAALRAPQTVLPGEQAVYERVGDWVGHPMSRYREVFMCTLCQCEMMGDLQAGCAMSRLVPVRVTLEVCMAVTEEQWEQGAHFDLLCDAEPP